MTTHKTQPLGGRLVSWPVMMLAPFVVLCLLLILKRLVLGLGDVSNLNGGYPWGIWIAFESAGGHRFGLRWLGVGLGCVCVQPRGISPAGAACAVGQPVRLFAGRAVNHHRRRPLLEPALLLYPRPFQHLVGAV